LAYQNGLSDTEWLDYIRTEGDIVDATYDELLNLYRLRKIPGYNEMTDDLADLEAVEEDFRVLYMQKPSHDLPGQNLNQDAFSDESIEMTIDSIEGRVASGGELSLSQARTLAELKWTRRFRIMDDLDGDLPEPLPSWNTVNDIPSVPEIIDGGGEIVLSAAEEDVAVSAISTSVVASVIGGAIGIVLGVGMVVYQEIKISNERNRVIGLVDDSNQVFKWRLGDLETKLGVKITVSALNTDMGTIWSRRTFRWSERDVLSESVLSYLDWRLENPGVISPSIERGAEQVSDLYLKYLSVGGLFVQDWFPQEYTPDQYALCTKLGLNTLNNDEHQYLKNFAAMKEYKAKQNGAVFEGAIRRLIKTHKLRPTESAYQSDFLAAVIVAKHVQAVPTWSLLPGKSVTAGVSFSMKASQEDAMDAMASMHMPVWDIKEHIDCMRRFSNELPRVLAVDKTNTLE
jgi:hypothetical protein